MDAIMDEGIITSLDAIEEGEQLVGGGGGGVLGSWLTKKYKIGVKKLRGKKIRKNVGILKPGDD
jgi:hypothetical protein